MSPADKITIRDVAKLAKVSIATVSRYINNPGSLKEANRYKVEQVVKELNYQPMAFAQRLAGGKVNTFGLIIPGYEGVFFSYYSLEVIRDTAAALDAAGIDLHLHIYWSKDTFRASLVDGVVFADILGNEKQLRRITEEKVPCVVINRRVDEIPVSYVAVDNFKGAYDAVEFLIRHGHKRIAHLVGDLNTQCAQERLEGYKKALEKNSIPVREEYIQKTQFSRKEARECLKSLFEAKEIPTAIFCCSDDVASEVLAFAEEKNVSIPKSLSVIGFDDNPHCIYGDVMLTTVRQPIQKMTQIAVDILKEAVKGNREVKKVILDPELVVRDSVSFV